MILWTVIHPVYSKLDVYLPLWNVGRYPFLILLYLTEDPRIRRVSKYIEKYSKVSIVLQDVLNLKGCVL